MANKGLRFFGIDYNNNQFDGSPTASSNTSSALFAFDGLKSTRWISSGENTDGDAVSLTVDYGFNRTINALYVFNHNIEDIVVEYWNGSSWVAFTSSNATITASADGYYLFIKTNTDITTAKVRIVGEDTIIANQEKYVTLFYAFYELGQYKYFPDFEPSINSAQNVFSMTDGRSFIIERGETFSGKISLKSHVNQDDITLTETLLEYRQPFFIWPNGGDETIFRFSFKPFRFQDIYRVAVVGNNSPKFTKNYYKSGYNNTFSLIEVV